MPAGAGTASLGRERVQGARTHELRERTLSENAIAGGATPLYRASVTPNSVSLHVVMLKCVTKCSGTVCPCVSCYAFMCLVYNERERMCVRAHALYRPVCLRDAVHERFECLFPPYNTHWHLRHAPAPTQPPHATRIHTSLEESQLSVLLKYTPMPSRSA